VYVEKKSYYGVVKQNSFWI